MFLPVPYWAACAAAPANRWDFNRHRAAQDGCYECHWGEGQGAVTSPRLNQNPVTYARFTSYIWKPCGEMPPYTAKVVSYQQAADIFAFLQSLPKPPAVENIPLLKQ